MRLSSSRTKLRLKKFYLSEAKKYVSTFHTLTYVLKLQAKYYYYSALFAKRFYFKKKKEEGLQKVKVKVFQSAWELSGQIPSQSQKFLNVTSVELLLLHHGGQFFQDRDNSLAVSLRNA